MKKYRSVCSVLRLTLAAVLFAAAPLRADAPAAETSSKLERTRAILAVEQDKQQNSAARQIAAAPEMNLPAAGTRMFEGLLLCLGVLFVGVHLYRRFNPAASVRPSKKRRMRILERLPLGNKSSLVLAEIEGRTVAIAIGQEQASFFEVSLDRYLADGAKAEDPAREERAPFVGSLERVCVQEG